MPEAPLQASERHARYATVVRIPNRCYVGDESPHLMHAFSCEPFVVQFLLRNALTFTRTNQYCPAKIRFRKIKCFG